MSDRENLQWLVTGHRAAASISAAVSLGLLDELAEGPRAAEEVATPFAVLEAVAGS